MLHLYLHTHPNNLAEQHCCGLTDTHECYSRALDADNIIEGLVSLRIGWWATIWQRQHLWRHGVVLVAEWSKQQSCNHGSTLGPGGVVAKVGGAVLVGALLFQFLYLLFVSFLPSVWPCNDWPRTTFSSTLERMLQAYFYACGHGTNKCSVPLLHPLALAPVFLIRLRSAGSS